MHEDRPGAAAVVVLEALQLAGRAPRERDARAAIHARHRRSDGNAGRRAVPAAGWRRREAVTPAEGSAPLDDRPVRGIQLAPIDELHCAYYFTQRSICQS